MTILNIINLLCIVMLSGLVTGFVIVTLSKWQVFEYYEGIRKKWMPAMPETCLHCLSFWFSIPPIIALMIWTGVRLEWIYILAPFASASVAKWSNNYR